MSAGLRVNPCARAVSLLLRSWLLVSLAFPCAAAPVAVPAPTPIPAPPGHTRNVILVTLDGVRVQEVFGGLDETIAVHDEQQVYSDMAAMRARFGGATPEARREALLPNFWKTLAPLGMVLGNPAYGNHVKVQNRVQWSTPGYTEMLTGQPRAEVEDNEHRRYGYPTALEHARAALGLGYQQVAQIGSSDTYKRAAASRDDAFLMVGTYDSVPAPWGSPHMDLLAALRRQVLGLWDEGSNDTLTFRMAQAYIERNNPRVLWLALVNSDDWAHSDRYDRYLAHLHLADALIGELWQTLQALDEYRDRTTLIITTDHGRGLQGADWAEHDVTIPGSDDIWLAVVGPDTPDLGEVREQGTLYQGQVAGTLLQFLGLDVRAMDPAALPPAANTLVVSD
ncbi:MAG: hypothetical protein EHM68_03925 [Lysobacterales bacterium]|nr:MAG: hypothetical protein EHM68_03925 [Xanthomonadales bacterium]